MRILGLYFDRPYLQLAFLDRRGKARSLQCCLPPDPFNVKQLYMKGWRGRTATAFPLSTRHLEFKITSRKQIEKGLPFQLETLTQLPLEELVFVSQTTTHNKGSKATLFFSAKKVLHHHLQQWHDRALEPDFVTGIPNALRNFALYHFTDLSSFFIVDLGSQEWTCVWIEENEVRRSFTISEGVESLMVALWEDRKKVLFQKEIDEAAQQIDLLTSPLHLYPKLSQRLASARNNLCAALTSFRKMGGPHTVIFTGRTHAFGHLGSYLLQNQPELSMYQPSIFSKKEELCCAIAIGAALEASAKEGVQFLRGEFIPRKGWQKAGRWGIGLLTFSFLCSLLLLSLGLRQTRKERVLISNAIQEWSRELEPGRKAVEMDDFIHILEKNSRDLPYILQSPTVTEVLSWISAEASNLEIIDLQYQLISCPHIGALQDPYCAKVSFEFKAPNSMAAREFHDLLLKGNSLVNPQKEISWESSADQYRTSFYLKNKAPYGR